MAKTEKIFCIGFDGNVSQESTWSNNVRNYCKLKGKPVFPFVYKKYKVNELAKNAQLVYNANKIFFPPGFAKTPDGKTFLEQLFSFTGKKSSRKDDAPDWLICSNELIVERGFVRSASQEKFPLITIL
jgi:hypothetical protein